MNLNHPFLSFLLLLSFFSIANVNINAQSYAPTADEKFLLWEITGKNLDAPSYLFGTIHMIPADDYVLSNATQEAFDKSKKVVFEIDTEAMMNPMNMMGLLSKMYMNNDTSLADLLTDEEYEMVSNHFDKLGLPFVFLSKIKPMFLSVLAGEDMENMDPSKGFEFGGDNIKSYELELTERAKLQEKPIEGLETAEFQMSLFDSIPYSAQAQMLVEAIQSEKDTTDTSSGTFDQMVQLYLDQDITGMQSMISDDSDGIGAYEDLLLLKRNRNWIPVIEGFMKENTTFFAVGAGHLGGEEGVIALLRKAGYVLKPVGG